VRRFLVVSVVSACSGAPAPTAQRVANHTTHVQSAAHVADADGDGVPDDRDRCPDAKEDYDVFEDEDGCPDPDNDGDGVADADDDCPYAAGSARGCATACRVFVTDNEDCFLDPSVFYDARERPQPERIAQIVKLVRDNPMVHGLEVIGLRAELVVKPLRDQLPGIEIREDHRDIGVERAIYVRITKQLLDEGRFRSMECTPFGPIYHPARQADCTR